MSASSFQVRSFSRLVQGGGGVVSALLTYKCMEQGYKGSMHACMDYDYSLLLTPVAVVWSAFSFVVLFPPGSGTAWRL